MDAAVEILSALDDLGIEIRLNDAGKLVLRPAAKVPRELADRCRRYEVELRALVASREVTTPRGLPCQNCRGSGREPCALDKWPDIEYLLRALMWRDARIVTVRSQIREDEYLIAVRPGGIDLKDASGNCRTLGMYDA